ncbi:B3/B4 domain-containing protein [Streptomyces monashensis]|uniref:B3/B4 tRNA-binding domain-containing protein n=1 Tax=Streptomyces monashensis TaxID=1678012 RepID=A0A1S2PGP6_9ACTN|nr:phenylalanine--tRNA ligase beta subunit-related protein [Streptomyces monashensis]OIJ92988.1 hypothetical protein BIV23_38210 [Streptomyces monashensis]
MDVTFALDPDVLAAHPEAQVRFVVARGLAGDVPWPDAARETAALEQQVSAGLHDLPDEQHPAIASWFTAYRAFGTNPRRSRPSVDALIRRLRRTGRLPRINPAVDAYNLVSVRHALPAGAFDLARLSGPVTIRHAVDGDVFVPLGADGTDGAEHPGPGEVVYAQGSQVLTRHWNHRDSDISKVTEDSRDVVFLLERVSRAAVPDALMVRAQDDLAALVTPHAREVSRAVIEARTPLTPVLTHLRGMSLT